MNKPFIFLLAASLLTSMPRISVADEDAGKQIQQQFDSKFKNYMGTGSQALLPLPTLEKQDWEQLRTAHNLKKIFIEPDVFYNNKNYVFTLYQSDDGNYFLDVKGGFWGMDELFYGPIDPKTLQ